jgi:hypothetical protein
MSDARRTKCVRGFFIPPAARSKETPNGSMKEVPGTK